MNFDHYKNFVAVVDAGTILAASRELLIAQPALSAQIKNLEDEFGAQLIIRKPRHIELTDAGQILYDRIKSMIYLEDSAHKEIGACVAGNRGTLRIATTPAFPDPLIQQLLLEYHAQNPDVTFEMFEYNSGAIIENLLSGVIEVGLIRSQALPSADIEVAISIDEQYYAVYSRQNEYFSPRIRQLRLSDLDGIPLSISRGLVGTFTAACQQAGFEPTYMNISSSRATSQLFAADRRAVAIMVGNPQIEKQEGDLCFRPIIAAGLSTSRMFVVDKNRTLSFVANGFIGYCKNHALMRQWSK